MTIKLAIIGSGPHAREQHAIPLLREKAKGRVELAAVCGKDLDSANAFAKDFGFAKVYSDVDVMVREVKPEAIVVVTPVSVNFSLAKKLIPLGIPLMIEKPPGTSSLEAAELHALAEKHKTRVMVSFNRRFAPALLKMREWLDAQPAGKSPRMMRVKMLRVGRSEPEFTEATAIHSLDALISFMGEPAGVSGQRLKGGPRNALPASISFADGSVCEFTLNPETGAVQESYELIGPDYFLEADFAKGVFSAWRDGKLESSFATPEDAIDCERQGSVSETSHFFDCLETGRPFAPDLRHGIAVMKLAEALKSLR